MRKNLCHVFFPEGHELSFAGILTKNPIELGKQQPTRWQ